MWTDAAPVNRPVGRLMAVASSQTTSTFDPASRWASASARVRSNSTAVTRVDRGRRTSVVNPGPGPISTTSSPRDTPRRASGRIVSSIIWRHCGLAQNSRCPRFMSLHEGHNRHDVGGPGARDSQFFQDGKQVTGEGVEVLLTIPDVEHHEVAVLTETRVVL